MEQQSKDLKTFGTQQLEELRELYGKGSNSLFFDELETLLKIGDYSEKAVWERMENDDIILGEVWSHPIGKFYHKHVVHEFSYLYVESQGLSIAEHGHKEPANRGKQIRKIREWYVFPDGRMELCQKDCTHWLINDYQHPIYVLSVKIKRNGDR